MTKIRPFRAIRPKRDKVHLFASRSLLTYSNKTKKEKIQKLIDETESTQSIVNNVTQNTSKSENNINGKVFFL